MPKSEETALIEHGIDAYPEADAIFIEWFKPKDGNVQWIEIYRRGETEERFVLLMKISNSDTFFIDQDVEIGKRYFYYLIAEDRSGNISLPSDTVDYLLYPKPKGLMATTDSTPTFYWYYEDVPPKAYFVRVEDVSYSKVIWKKEVVNQFDSIVSLLYNQDGKAIKDSLDPSGNYRWRVDVLGSEMNSGSESRWNWIYH